MIVTEMAYDFEKQLSGRKIFVTGHSGFTGGWASLWLKTIGAEVYGYSLEPETSPSFFHDLGLQDQVHSRFGDICNPDQLAGALQEFQPELILHLAAQPLVLKSYRDPLHTFLVNSLGTGQVLDQARKVKSIKGVLCVTTDKVYKDNRGLQPYRESDPLGGHDPYSASKAAAELIIQSYAASFSYLKGEGPAIATARAGNILGGGDWSDDRLIPDFVRAVVSETPLTLRYPDAVRPWQSVLAVVQGYLTILAGLISPRPGDFAKAWNLGPSDQNPLTVRQVIESLSEEWIRPELKYLNHPLPEAMSLTLESSMAQSQLNWRPTWNIDRILRETAWWYREYYRKEQSPLSITLAQIESWRREGLK
ncbi:MAG: CDP-glucose 4,6-dehydratase [Bdellovibrionales bacterium]|nr:CDP-glucose 4,6-dehydratase [Bdellovibrionales bacterium]